MKIIYTKNRHGYAKIDDSGDLVIKIPQRLKNNEKFKQELIQKAEQLQKKQAKKEIRKAEGDDRILIFGEKADKSTIKKGELKNILLDYAQPILDEYSQKIGKSYSSFKVRKVKSKRGSCSSEQQIMLNLNLIHLPTKYIKYVIIHEACHLKQKNHGPKFWNLVEKHCPNYKILRKEMRKFHLKVD